MIGYIKGKVLDFSHNTVLLENNGIGYEITCSNSAFTKLVNNKEGEVYTYLQVKDDGLALFGFSSKEEKAMFLKLITVSGVGAKMGINILSSMNLNNLALVIAESDVKSLSKIKGCGKKTAERIIIELREKISSLDLGGSEKIIQNGVTSNPNDEDAMIALLSLGFSRAECEKALKTARDNGGQTLEELITESLKSMN